MAVDASQNKSAASDAGQGKTPPSMSRLHQDLRELAEQSHAPHAFLAQAVQRVATYFQTPYIALTARFGAESIEDAWHQGTTDPNFWRSIIESHLTDTVATGKSSCKLLGKGRPDKRIALLGVPLRDNAGRGIGGVALILGACDKHAALSELAVLESVIGYMSLCLQGVGLPHQKTPMAKDAGVATLLSTLNEHQRPEEIAFAVTNRLRAKLGCDQVALGIPVGHKIRVISVSGLDDINRRSPGIRHLRSAMEECYDLRDPIICPGYHAWATSSEGAGFRLHGQWSQQIGGDSVASFPISSQGRVAAVVSLRRKADRPLTEVEIQDAQAMLSHLAPAIGLTRLARRNLIHHARDSAWAAWRKLIAPKARRWQVIGGCAALLMGWIVFGSMNYQLAVPCVMQAQERRHITAPFNGVISGQNAVAGDVVKAGQILCTLDNRELLLQKNALGTQWKVLDAEKDQALANDQVAAGRILAAKQDEIRAQLNLVQWQLDQTEIRAPMDAVVLTGDLRKKVGSPIEAGQSLFEIAPPHRVYLELIVPEEEIDEIQGHPAGVFATNAAPEIVHPLRITTIRPSATVKGNRTVFVCEAQPDQTEEWFRSGMEGAAQISVGGRPVWWVMLHKMIDYVRMKAWL